MSGRFSFAQSGLLSRLKTPRGMIAAAVVGAGLAGGWFYFSNTSPQTAGAMTRPPAAKPDIGSRRGGLASTRPSSIALPTTQPTVAPLASSAHTVVIQETDPLGAEYIDKARGFSIRFPDGWAIRTFAADPWVLDCGDATNGMISIGFVPCPASMKAEQLLPESIARRIKRTPNTTMIAQGRTTFAGHKALWFKSTGPLPLTNGSPTMTRVQYMAPLGDGRILEIRVAAPPAQFAAVGNVMKQSMDTLSLVPHK